MTGAMEAARKECRERVEQMIARKDNLDELIEGTGMTEVHKAVLNDDAPLVRMILQAGASPNVKEARSEWTPLMIATFKKNCEVLEILLDHSANVNEVNKDRQQTALHIAVGCGEKSKSIVRTLLSHGSDINALDDKKRCPASLAVVKHDFQSLKVMLKHGANVERCIDFAGDFTNRLMCECNKYAEFMDTLLSAGGDINFVSDGLGWTQLIHAVVRRNLGSFIYLLKTNADISVTCTDGFDMSAVDYAVGSICAQIFLHGVTVKDVHILFGKLCMAAGGVLQPYKDYGNVRYCMEKYFPEFVEKKGVPHLIELSRKAIRCHLLQVNPPGNLFTYVPMLKGHVPSTLASYLLYNFSLDDFDDQVSEEYSQYKKKYKEEDFCDYPEGPPVGVADPESSDSEAGDDDSSQQNSNDSCNSSISDDNQKNSKDKSNLDENQSNLEKNLSNSDDKLLQSNAADNGSNPKGDFK